MTDQKWVKITRTFDAPIAAVWAMWTDPDMFKQWYGPRGMSVPTAQMNLMVGGTRLVCMSMQTPQRSVSMWFTGVFKEITAPTRLVYTESMCDESGTIIKPSDMGMPPGTPDVTEIIIDLTETDGKTTMTMVHAGIPAGSPGEGGWNQAFDKMAALFG